MKEEFSINKQILQLRKEKNLTGAQVAQALGISKATYYRYEKDGTKVPAEVLHKMCEYYQVTPAYFFQGQQDPVAFDSKSNDALDELQENFQTPQEAMEFLLKMPLLASYGEYNPEILDEQELVDFSNEVLEQFKLVSYKYKK